MNDFTEDEDEEIQKQSTDEDRKYVLIVYNKRAIRKGKRVSKWKQIDRLYTRKEIEMMSKWYYQYGDVIKIKRTDNM